MSPDRPKLWEAHDPEPTDDPETTDGDPHEELSLRQLSEAYAQVLQDRGESDEPDESISSTEPRHESIDDDAGFRDGAGGIALGKSAEQLSFDEMDAADNAACAISPKSIVEAILFVGAPRDVKLTAKKLAAVMRDVSHGEVKSTIEQLNREYEANHSAFRIVDDSGTLRMQLCEDLIEVQNHFFGRNRGTKLSQSTIDVLAIVGYNQPVSRTRVDAIRGHASGGVLSQLLRRELVAIIESQGSNEKLYVTSDRFLQLFGLQSLDDLPRTSVVSDLEELTDP